jgi:predicted DCC family thiol-disulfide oxidoreductase YuxK
MTGFPGSRALLVYDGRCGFCRLWIGRWRGMTGERVVYATFQEVAGKFPDVPLERFRRAVHLIDEDGTTSDGAEAVFRLLAHAPGRGWTLTLYRRLPGFAPLSEACYRFIANRRGLFFKLTGLLWGKRLEAPRYGLVARLFVQALGLVYFAAFISLFVQIPGLLGENGILPAGPYLQAAGAQLGYASRWFLPTLAWLGADAGTLQLIALLGAAAALLAVGGIAVAPALAFAWLAWLSLVVVGQDFLSFQWDHLLLEAGFLAIFLTPFRLTARFASRLEASPIVVWLYRWLLFRLLFSSGAIKLMSGDPTWRNLTAMRYHFETQPLPNPIAWFVHRLPELALKAATLLTLAIELVLPFLFFFPPRIRRAAAFGAIGLQVLILLTGNYAYFNWLTLALCLFLFDDGWIEWLFRLKPPPPDTQAVAAAAPIRVRRIALATVATLAVVLGAVRLGGLFRPLPASAAAVASFFAPLRIVNGYGLFAVMTTTRPEIVIEGSDDGLAWKEYAFRHKPGDVRRAPSWIAPHQPRLDWQMWFAALGDAQVRPWFANFVIRLLQGKPEVTRLLAENPFPGTSPKWIRAKLYLYRFTDAMERRDDGSWWRREFKLDLFEPVTLQR